MMESMPWQFGDYQVVAVLKKGGEAVVCIGKHNRTGEVVVIRILLMDENTEVVRRHFEEEVKNLQQLKHPYIISLKAFGMIQGYAYLVMPYVPDGSLADLVRNGQQFTFDETLEYLLQAAEALSYAHAHNITHRDVNPANLLRGSNGILLSDFGIARDGEATKTSPRGTLRYCPLEQATGDPKPASDQYALAVTACWLFTGKFPADGGLDDLHAWYPKVAFVLARALENDPAMRYPSMMDFARALERAALFGGAQPPQSPTRFPPQSPVASRQSSSASAKHRQRPVVVVSSVLLVAVLGTLLWVWWPVVPKVSLEFPVPATGTLPAGITQTPHGSIGFIDLVGSVWLLSPNGTRTLIPFPDGKAHLLGAITSGANNILFWVTDYGNDQLIGLNANGEQQSFQLPSGGGPVGIVQASDGTLWVTDYEGNQLLRISPGGKPESFPLPGLMGIAQAPDGTLWATDYQGGQILHILPDGVIIKKFRLQAKSGPEQITVDSADRVWFTESLGNQIGRITPDGQLTEFSLSMPASSPAGITEGPDGNLWFTEAAGNQIGRITPDGQLTECTLPQPDSRPNRITRGPGNTLWFTEAAGRIGRITLRGGLPLFGLLACF